MQTTLDSIPAFYNTNQTVPDDLITEIENAFSQEQKIMLLFARRQYLSPSQVNSYFTGWPITSIRRAISNLTKRGILLKTRHTRKGPYHKNEYIWKIANTGT